MSDFLEEIAGQKHAKRLLRTSLEKNEFYNFLFTGPRGVGKRMTAFALARAIGSPVGSGEFTLIGPVPAGVIEKKDKIHEYLKQYLPDQPFIPVHEKISIHIEQIRSLIEDLSLMPIPGRRRFVLILEADKMTEEAANCFLKTLEEPPVDTLFVLVTSRLEHVLPTIRSRCQIIHFYHLTDSDLRSVLFEHNDDFLLGSPGEIMALRHNPLQEQSVEIFKRTPLSVSEAANLARKFSREKTIDLIYPLLLLYRLLMYRALNLPGQTAYESLLDKKIKRVSLASVLDTITRLDAGIIALEQNPNHLLLLFNLLLKLP